MKKVLLMAFSLLTMHLVAQDKHNWNLAFTDQASAYPFSILSGYVKEPLHPGLDLSFGKVLSDHSKHQWFREYHLGYFFHRFVQHGIPLNIQYGYRYKMTKEFFLESSLGGGYFHSIPATAVLKLNENGEYTNAKGIGKPQVMLAFNLGLHYQLVRKQSEPVGIFLQYQQRLQAPFVRSYVPILPYVGLSIGASFHIQKQK